MFKIAIFGPIASGKSSLATALIDGVAVVDYRFSSELALANRMVFGANDSFTIYPTNEATKHGLGVMTVEKKAQSDFFRKIRTGILGYTDRDIAYVKTEYPCKLMNLGVEIIDLPYSTKDNYQLISDILFNSDLIIFCNSFCHLPNLNDHFRLLEHKEVPILYATTHFDYYGFEKEFGNYYEIQERISSEFHALFPEFTDNQLYLFDSNLYIQGLKTNDMTLIDRSRFLYLKTEIYRQVAKAYFDKL